MVKERILSMKQSKMEIIEGNDVKSLKKTCAHYKYRRVTLQSLKPYGCVVLEFYATESWTLLKYI